MLSALAALVHGAKLELTGSSSSIVYNRGAHEATLTASCGGNPSVTDFSPRTLVGFPYNASETVTAHLHGVLTSCAGALMEQPCVSNRADYPALFECSWVGTAGVYEAGSVTASLTVHTQGDLVLGVQPVVACPVPPYARLLEITGYAGRGETASVNMTVHHYARSGPRVELPFSGIPGTAITIEGLSVPPSSPAPSIPPSYCAGSVPIFQHLQTEVYDGSSDACLRGTITADAANANLPTESEPVTVSLDFKCNGGSGGVNLYAWGSASSSGCNAMHIGSSSLNNYWYGNDNAWTYPTSLSADVCDNAWHTIVTSYDGTTRTLFMDGVTLSTKTDNGDGTHANRNDNFCLGGETSVANGGRDTYFFTGSIRNLHIFATGTEVDASCFSS
jgi:hypothetical protein